MSNDFTTTSTITIKGNTIPVSGEPGVDLEIAINSTNFQDWKKNALKNKNSLQNLEILQLIMRIAST